VSVNFVEAHLVDLVLRWAEEVGVGWDRLPRPSKLRRAFRGKEPAYRPPSDAQLVAAWERRHGFRLPRGLRGWLLLSDGFYRGGPLVHPLSAIGPMVPFARVPEMVVQPESWFELGNPGAETVCIDLAYRWPGGCCPIFTSGDDQRQAPPRLIAPSFESWFVRLLHEGGREFWFDPDFVPLGDPWAEHRHRAPVPPLPDHLRGLASRALALMRPGADDRSIAASLGISRGEVEALFRHLQHAPNGAAAP
jgi:hypothetical protein